MTPSKISIKPTLLERFKLLFYRQRWHFDDGVSIFTAYKRMGGKTYILKQRPYGRINEQPNA